MLDRLDSHALTDPWEEIDLDAAPGDLPVAFGLELEPESLLAAYRRGIFPWPVVEPELAQELEERRDEIRARSKLFPSRSFDEFELAWWCPDPRGLFDVHDLYLPKRLATTFRNKGWTATLNRAFDDVIQACVARAGDESWITPEICAIYRELHDAGHVISSEVWDSDGTLIGGLYGVLVGGMLTGESMFFRTREASKATVFDLSERLRRGGGRYLDTQVPNPHFEQFGATEPSRAEFLRKLAEVGNDAVVLDESELPISRLASPN